MASYNYTFTSGDTVTPTKLNDARTVSEIVNADIKSDAAIAGTKIAPNFGSQNVVTTGAVSIGTPATNFNLTAAHSATDGGWLHGSGTSSYLSLGGFGGASEGAFRLNYERTTGLITFTGGTRDTPVSRMVIDNVGNVGIGTNNPQQNLHVAGVARFDNNILMPGGVDRFIEIGAERSVNGNVYIDLISDTTYTDYGLRIFRADTGANAAAEIVNRGTGTFTINTQDAGALRFSTSNTERMRIDASGNVGIGTSSPNAAALVDVSSTTKGFLPPRMTGAQRDAISTPPAGLVIYNTSTNVLNFYNGSAWGAV